MENFHAFFILFLYNRKQINTKDNIYIFNFELQLLIFKGFYIPLFIRRVAKTIHLLRCSCDVFMTTNTQHLLRHVGSLSSLFPYLQYRDGNVWILRWTYRLSFFVLLKFMYYLLRLTLNSHILTIYIIFVVFSILSNY